MSTSTSSPTTEQAAGRRSLQIDVWSDLACPWCYVGKNRLDRAVAASPHAAAITVRTHSYELDPSMSREARPNLELIAAKYGVSADQAARMEDQVAAVARQDGLPYTSDRLVANSFDVHRVLHLADTVGLADSLLGALQRELFSGRVDVFDHAELTGIAHRLGVARERVEEVLAGDEYADAVRADEQEAASLGITGVPFTVLDGRLAIPGATSVEGFAGAIEHAWGTE